MQPLLGLLKMADKRPAGPSPTFNAAHIVLAIQTIGGSGGIGRQALSVETGLGPGAVRTVLKKLREEGLSYTDTSGCHLTEKGRGVYKSIVRRLSPTLELQTSALSIGKSQAAVAVRGGGGKVGSGIEQRDSSIMVGALGTTTYVIKGGRFSIPGGSSDCERDFPGPDWSVLRKDLRPREADAVIVCGAHEATRSRVGAVSAALTLL